MSRKMIIGLIVLVLGFVTVLGISGCGQAQKPIEESNSMVSRISVSPEAITLAPNGFYQFQASLYDSNNNVVTNESITINWSVSGSVGTITQSGTFTATAVGEGQIYASIGNVRGAANITVVDGTPPNDFNLITTSNEVIASTETYTLSWTASGSQYNGLSKYQILGRESNWVTGDFGVLKNDIDPSSTSATVDLMVDGVWELKVRAVDSKGLWRDSDGTSAAGDVGDSSRKLTVIRDTIPPNVFTISQPWHDGQKFDEKDVRVAWEKASDENLDHYELVVGTDPNDVQGSSIYNGTFSANASREVWLTNLARGKYYMYMITYDKAGHWRRLDGKTDIPERDVDLTYAWEGKWPAFKIIIIPDESSVLFKPPTAIGGANWLFIDDKGNLWTWSGSQVGLAKSEDSGNTWTVYTSREGFMHNDIRWVTQDKNGNIWVSNYYYVFRTPNYGLTWQKIGDIWQADGIYVDNQNAIWVGTYERGLYKSVDNGASWTNFGKTEGLATDFINTIFVDSRGTIWVGANGEGVFKSTNGGASWSSFTTTDGLASNYVNAIYVDINGVVWVGTTGGLCKSSDGVATWTTVIPGGMYYGINVITADKNGVLWAGGIGLWKSENYGQAWVPYLLEDNCWQGGTPISSIAFDLGNQIWLGTFQGIVKGVASPLN